MELHRSDVNRPGRQDAAGRLVLRGGHLEDGTLADVAVDRSTGRISAVGRIEAAEGDEVDDCRSMVVLPAGVEAHAHLDKALLSTDTPMPADLDAGVAEWFARVGDLSHESFVERATRTIEMLVAHGTTTIRSHVDVATAHGLRGVHALIEVRDRIHARGLADIELVGLAAPLGGVAGEPVRQLLDEAIRSGIDVVGASPDISGDPIGATTDVVNAAARSGLPMDVHTDQSVDAEMFYLPELIQQVRRQGLTNVVASHCVSLASQPIAVQQRIADELAEAGIAVFTMPLSSLFLFGWDELESPPRGVTAINTLRRAGVVVAAGSDNVQDPFFPFGRCDPFETAGVLALVAHLSAGEAWTMVSGEARKAMGRESVSVAVGSRADLVAIEGTNITNALSMASEVRTVLHRGRVVARTTAKRSMFA